MPVDVKDAPAKRIRLLLVDDEEGYVNVLANRMSRRGMDVSKAFSGAEALQAVRRQAFDVAVLDLKMKDMDGIEVLRMFRQMNEDMAVIILTGHGSQTAVQNGIRYGAFDYLTKPCELEDLVEKIREAHQGREKNGVRI